MLTIIARISAKTTDNQIPFIPKMEGMIKIMITWKTSVLKKEIRADTKPSLWAVKKDEA